MRTRTVRSKRELFYPILLRDLHRLVVSGNLYRTTGPRRISANKQIFCQIQSNAELSYPAGQQLQGSNADSYYIWVDNKKATWRASTGLRHSGILNHCSFVSGIYSVDI